MFSVQPLQRLLLALSILLTFPLQQQQASAANILSVAFVSSKSHKITYEPLLYELAARGHQVTILAPFISGKSIPNVKEILTLDAEKAFDEFPNMFEMKEKNEAMGFAFMAEHMGRICSATYDLPHVRALMSQTFDLIILQPMFNECAAGFVSHFNTSVVLVTPGAPPPWISQHFGNPHPVSFIPNFMAGFLSDRLTFYQRVVNFISEIGMSLVLTFQYVPHMEAIYREKLGNPGLAGSDELIKNASLLLTNSHFSLSQPKPFLPDIIEVGGMHCRPAKPLPKDLDEFLNSSGPDGFIYFSMGSALKGSTMSEKSRQMFLRTFAKLKQKVLWKWETEKMDDLPPNVKLSKWLPQQDVLGHPKIRAFITHGGFGGTTEAVYHGVPLIGIPMFGDQNMNMKKSEAQGFAINLDFNSLSEEMLLGAVNEVLTQPSYREKVQYLSKIFRDQPDKPLERAVFWTEYVIRHKGAVHLRSAARELNFIQYHSIDVVATLAAIIFTVFYLVFAIGRFFVRKLCGSKKISGKSTKDVGLKKKN